MTELPNDLKFARSHEWARDNDGVVTVGITDHAQRLLGDLVFVELPEVGQFVEVGEECAVVESVKAASDIYSPVMGEVVEVNTTLMDKPELVNESPYKEGWLFKVKRSPDDDGLDALLTAVQYIVMLENSE